MTVNLMVWRDDGRYLLGVGHTMHEVLVRRRN
jgi:hypothetical protein